MCLINQDDPGLKRLFLLTQIALIAFFLLAIPERHYPNFHPHLIEAARGVFLGIAIGLVALSGWKNRQRMAQ